MSVHEAVNPRHARSVDTSGLWWTGNAWNARTFDLIASDRTRVLFSSFLEGVTLIQRMNLPGLLPPHAWLPELAESLFDLPATPKSVAHLSSEMRTAFALDSWVRSDRTHVGSATCRHVSKLIMTMTPLTEGAVDPAVFFKKDKQGQWQLRYTDVVGVERGRNTTYDNVLSSSLAGLANNPSLPLLNEPAHPDTTMTVYRWMLARTLVDASSSSQARELLPELLRNFSATQKDFEFVLKSLDKTAEEDARRKSMKRARFDPANYRNWPALIPYGNRQHLMTVIAHHPNFVSWPSVDEAHPLSQHLAVPPDHGLASTAVPKLADSVSSSSRQGTEAQEVLFENLFFEERGRIQEWVSSQLRTFYDPEAVMVAKANAAFSVGVCAAFLGAMFSETEKALEAEDIPLEWLVEVL